MAVQVAQDWVTPPAFSGSVDPSGAITLGTGTNRTLIFVMTTDTGNEGSITASAAIAGIAATGQGKGEFEYATGFFLTNYYFYWDEVACQSISAESSSNITWSDNQINAPNRHASYATFASVDQTTPLSVISSASSAVTSSTPITLTVGGSAGDHVVLFKCNPGTARRPEWDTNLTERWDVLGPDYITGLADDAWASTDYITYHDDGELTAEELATGILVRQFAEAAITGSGSADGFLPTISGAGERIVVGSGSADGLLPTLAGVGENAVTGTGSADGYLPTFAGVGERVITASGSLNGILPTMAGQSPFLPRAYQVTLHQDPSNQAEYLKDEVGKAVIMEGDFFSATITMRI